MSQTASLDIGTDESAQPAPWPTDFQRVPDEGWTRQPPDDFGRQYDRVGNHGWYKNLEPIVAQVLATLDDDDILIDYSSGTGILARRILPALGRRVGVLNVDASPNFLRIALDNFADDERVAYRLLRVIARCRRRGSDSPRTRVDGTATTTSPTSCTSSAGPKTASPTLRTPVGRGSTAPDRPGCLGAGRASHWPGFPTEPRAAIRR